MGHGIYSKEEFKTVVAPLLAQKTAPTVQGFKAQKNFCFHAKAPGEIFAQVVFLPDGTHCGFFGIAPGAPRFAFQGIWQISDEKAGADYKDRGLEDALVVYVENQICTKPDPMFEKQGRQANFLFDPKTGLLHESKLHPEAKGYEAFLEGEELDHANSLNLDFFLPSPWPEDPNEKKEKQEEDKKTETTDEETVQK